MTSLSLHCKIQSRNVQLAVSANNKEFGKQAFALPDRINSEDAFNKFNVNLRNVTELT